MKHVVFIVGGYSPQYSAVGKCVANVAELVAENHWVTVVCERGVASAKRRESLGAQTIVRVTTPLDAFRQRSFEGAMQSQGPRRWLLRQGVFLARLTGYVLTVFGRTSLRRPLVAAFVAALEEIHLEKPIDLLVPACFPFEGVAAGVEFSKGKSVKLVPYLFDLFARSSSVHRHVIARRLKMQTHLELEDEMLRASTRLICVRSWQEHLRSSHPSALKQVIPVEHPLVTPVRAVTPCELSGSGPKIVYAGALLKSVRRPDYFIALFEGALRQGAVFALHIFATGDCDRELSRFARRFPGRVFFHGPVDSEAAEAAMVSADVLVSVGNSVSEQTPSKIFQYISTGKSVLHLSKVANDPVLDILGPYPPGVVLEERLSALDVNVTRLRALLEGVTEELSFQEVAQIFPDAAPSFTAQAIAALVDPQRGKNE